MSAAGAKRSNTVIVAVVVGLLTCGACGGAMVWVSRQAQTAFAQALGVDERWNAGLLSRSDVERQFELKLPAGAYTVYHRSMGFQDPYLDVLVPLADRAAFEKANGLTERPSLEDVSVADAQVRAVASPKGAVTAFDLEGITDQVSADGGATHWFRSGVVLVYDDQAWLYLVAFGT